VLDWASAATTRYRVRIVVLRPQAIEWRTPPGIDVIRLRSDDPIAALEAQGAEIRTTGNPVVLCHLLTAAERNALKRGGATPVPVVHNAQAGWIEPAPMSEDDPMTIAVSSACARELSSAGITRTTVVRHFPRRQTATMETRRYWRDLWAVPQDAFVVGMIGGIKPQKAYPEALRVLGALHASRDAWLVVIGGPVGKHGDLAWHAMLRQALRLGLDARVRFPGFIADAAQTLAAFDCLINTSHYEGLSIATLEALAAGLPVIATAVGGQGEIGSPGLHLLPPATAPARFAEEISRATRVKPTLPSWLGFPAHRLWTLMHLPVPQVPGTRVLFVTANLNAGGAQRSLTNLTKALVGRLSLEIAVCGASSSTAFWDELRAGGVEVRRTADSRDAFDHAQSILDCLGPCDIGRIVFWNVDAKVKLLLAKRLQYSPVRVIDVSPGAYAFEEMAATADFQRWIAFTSDDYYTSLTRLVLKFDGDSPVPAKTRVIPNGVPMPDAGWNPHRTRLRSVVVSGRIAPTKFLLEILAALRIVWTTHPQVELHILGTAEERHQDYAAAVLAAIGDDLDRRVWLHGASFDAPGQLARFDIALVLGHHQGSPNAVLEAMAAGVPVVANDSGGTRELVIHQRTGVLLDGREPAAIAGALMHLMTDPGRAMLYARRARAHVAKRFSMRAMVNAYLKLMTN
jgi:glycosyltransferase involved in cell wall biosynthesis